MDKAKDYLEDFKSINQEIKNYYANLDLKYDEFTDKKMKRVIKFKDDSSHHEIRLSILICHMD